MSKTTDTFGKPTSNTVVESFSGRLRNARLKAHWFLSLAGARAKIEALHRDYNKSSHTSLGGKTPIEHAATAAIKAAAERRFLNL